MLKIGMLKTIAALLALTTGLTACRLFSSVAPMDHSSMNSGSTCIPISTQANTA